MNDPLSNLHFGKSMDRIFCRKYNTNFAKKSQNRGKFLILGKYMGPIMGQNLVNVWVSFHFPRGTSLPKTILSTPPPRLPPRPLPLPQTN